MSIETRKVRFKRGWECEAVEIPPKGDNTDLAAVADKIRELVTDGKGREHYRVTESPYVEYSIPDDVELPAGVERHRTSGTGRIVLIAEAGHDRGREYIAGPRFHVVVRPPREGARAVGKIGAKLGRTSPAVVYVLSRNNLREQMVTATPRKEDLPAPPKWRGRFRRMPVNILQPGLRDLSKRCSGEDVSYRIIGGVVSGARAVIAGTTLVIWLTSKSANLTEDHKITIEASNKDGKATTIVRYGP